MRRSVRRLGRRSRNARGFSRGRGLGMRSRRGALRLFSRPEFKFHDVVGAEVLASFGVLPGTVGVGSSATTYFTTPASGGRVIPTLLSAIPGGSNAISRIGNSVLGRHGLLKVVLSAGQLRGGSVTAVGFAGNADNLGVVTEGGTGAVYDSSAGVNPITLAQKFFRTSFRIVVFRDTMVSLNASVPAVPIPPSIDDVFQVSQTSYVLANLNIETLGRYSLLYDRMFTCDSDDPQRTVSVSLPLMSHIRYGGAADDDIRAGQLYLCVFAEAAGMDLTTAGARLIAPVANYSWRLKYLDR